MKPGVVYLLTNQRLAARLVVSIWSLRNWYTGQITVFTTRPEAHEIGDLLERDKRLRISHCTIKDVPDDKPHISAYLTKAKFLSDSPYKFTVFLDADTLVVGRLDELLDSAITAPLTATVYARIPTNNSRVNRCLTMWNTLRHKKVQGMRIADLLDYVLQRPLPLVNVGVFTVKRSAKILRPWRQLTMIGRNMPTPEESALQLLLPRYDHQILGCHFNCLPLLTPHMIDVRIWHFAGVTHLKHSITQSLWLPYYNQCRRLNIACLDRWSHVAKQSAIQNRNTRESFV